jgi:hypothetical protein
VKAGELMVLLESKPAIDAFKSKAVCVAAETGLFASLVLSTFPIQPLFYRFPKPFL